MLEGIEGLHFSESILNYLNDFESFVFLIVYLYIIVYLFSSMDVEVFAKTWRRRKWVLGCCGLHQEIASPF